MESGVDSVLARIADSQHIRIGSADLPISKLVSCCGGIARGHNVTEEVAQQPNL